jgi:Ca-activated chloride channel family protein
MWNYEFMLKQANDQLRAAGREPLYAVYPAEGSAYADAPLGYVEHGQPKETRAFFNGLQAYLVSAEAQARVAADGRRTAPGAAAPARPEPDWNFDPGRVAPSVSLPEPDVILKALALYQEVLRRPSLTAICLDFSGSMQGEGEGQIRAAMHLLLTPRDAGRAMIQWSSADHIIIIPFDAQPRDVVEGDGSAASQAKLLSGVEAQTAGGGTDMYACARLAFQRMAPYLDRGGYLPTVIIMTDGRSDESPGFEGAWRADAHGVPIFSVTFGNADRSQLDHLADLTRARVFDGGKNLSDAFRSARGYN